MKCEYTVLDLQYKSESAPPPSHPPTQRHWASEASITIVVWLGRSQFCVVVVVEGTCLASAESGIINKFKAIPQATYHIALIFREFRKFGTVHEIISTKILTHTTCTCIRPAGRKLINSGHGIFEQRIREIISTKFSKTAICKNLDPRNISAIRYTLQLTIFYDALSAKQASLLKTEQHPLDLTLLISPCHVKCIYIYIV